MGTAEQTEINVNKGDIPPLSEGAEYYEEFLSGCLVNKENFLEVTEEDLAHLLADMERVSGREFKGNLSNAIVLLNEIVNGMSVPITEQFGEEGAAGVKFGLYWRAKSKDKAAALYHPHAKEYGEKNYYKTVVVELGELETLSSHDLTGYCEWKNAHGEVVFCGPVWFVARCVGLEEGAHYAYSLRKPKYQVAKQRMTLAEYRAVSVEYDALLWMRADAHQMKENRWLSSEDRDGIAKAAERFDEIYWQAREIRRQKAEAKKSKKRGGLHPFGV